MKYVFLALALISGSAGAMEMVSKGEGSNKLRLMQLPCKNEAVLDQLKPEHSNEFQAAEATIGRGTIAGCWISGQDNDVFLVFEDGSTFAMPQMAFKLEPGI